MNTFIMKSISWKILSMLLVVACSMGFTACSSDNDENEPAQGGPSVEDTEYQGKSWIMIDGVKSDLSLPYAFLARPGSTTGVCDFNHLSPINGLAFSSHLWFTPTMSNHSYLTLQIPDDSYWTETTIRTGTYNVPKWFHDGFFHLSGGLFLNCSYENYPNDDPTYTSLAIPYDGYTVKISKFGDNYVFDVSCDKVQLCEPSGYVIENIGPCTFHYEGPINPTGVYWGENIKWNDEGDDTSDDVAAVVGTWKYGGDNYWISLTLKSDKTFEYTEYDAEYGEAEYYNYNGTYTYDSKSKRITIRLSGYSETFEYCGNYLLDGDGDKWYKQ